MQGLYVVFKSGALFLEIIEYAIVIYCILSWFRPRFRAFFMLRQFIAPFLSPFQRLSYALMRRFNAPIDFTCFFAILGIQIIERLWWQLYVLLAMAIR